MAKKAKAKKPGTKPVKRPKAQTETGGAAKPSEVRSAITQAKLRSLLKSARVAQKDINQIAGDLGAEVKNAVDKDYLHRKAFSVCKTADRMEPEKLADFLDCLDHYLDISGLRDRASKVQRMDFGSGEDGEDDGEGEEAAGTNVEPFPAPTSVAAE